MNPAKAIVQILALLMAAGCGNDFCSRQRADEARFFAGKTRCEATSGATTMTVVTAYRASCGAAVANCTADDLRSLDVFISCREKAPSCTSGNELAAATAAFACQSTLSDPNGGGLVLSHACASTMFQQ